MFDYLELAKLRSSCRKYTDEPVSEEKIRKIILAANAAPVGSRRYADIHLTVVRDRRVLDALGEAAKERFRDRKIAEKIIGEVKAPEGPKTGEAKKKNDPFYHAPVVIFISHRKQDLQPGIEWANAAAVAYAMHLEAVSLGLGSVFIWGALEAARYLPEFDRTDLLKLPEDFQPLMGLAIGHCAEPAKPRELTDQKIEVNEIG